MKRSLLPLIVVSAVLLSCGSSETGTLNVTEHTTPLQTLDESALFSMEKVWPLLQVKTEIPKASKQFFLRGIDHLKNEGDVDSAIYLIRQSLCSFPSVKAYFELGNAYFEKGDRNNALLSFQMAEKLGYEPSGTVLFKMAQIHSVGKQERLAGQYLEYAIQSGFTDIDLIESDTSLNNLRKEEYLYLRHLKQGVRGLSNMENLLWLRFRKQFVQLNFPIRMDQQKARELCMNGDFIAYDYEKFISEMRDEKFSREVSQGFYYYGQLTETPEYVALIYLTKNEFADFDEPVFFTLAVFSTEGKLLDKKQLAGGNLYMNELTEAQILKDRTIEVKTYDLTYEKDPKKFGYEENRVTDRQLSTTKFWQLSESGKIEQKPLRSASLKL